MILWRIEMLKRRVIGYINHDYIIIVIVVWLYVYVYDHYGLGC